MPETEAINEDVATSLGDCSEVSRLTTWFEVWQVSMRRWMASRSSTRAADLDDVAQEVHQRLMRYGDDAVVQHPQSYLYRIATNVVNEWRKRSRNNLPHDDTWLADPPVEPAIEPEHAVEHALVSDQVRSAVSRLPLRQREVLLLHINADLTYKQIAHQLNLPPRIVRRDLARAYAQLRCELGTGGSGRH
jgi:RNA polymerase sigma-70 factor (ECF subfamily)